MGDTTSVVSPIVFIMYILPAGKLPLHFPEHSGHCPLNM